MNHRGLFLAALVFSSAAIGADKPYHQGNYRFPHQVSYRLDGRLLAVERFDSITVEQAMAEPGSLRR